MVTVQPNWDGGPDAAQEQPALGYSGGGFCSSGGDRDRERKRRALIRARATRPDVPIVRLDERAADRQPDVTTAERP